MALRTIKRIRATFPVVDKGDNVPVIDGVRSIDQEVLDSPLTALMAHIRKANNYMAGEVMFAVKGDAPTSILSTHFNPNTLVAEVSVVGQLGAVMVITEHRNDKLLIEVFFVDKPSFSVKLTNMAILNGQREDFIQKAFALLSKYEELLKSMA